MTLLHFGQHHDYFLRHFHYGSLRTNLNARVSMCGYESQNKENYLWHGLKRGENEILLWQYTLSGAGELVRGGKRYKVAPGQAMLVRIPDDHYYHVAPEADHWEFVFLIFRGAECMRLRNLILEDHPPVSEQFVTLPLLQVAHRILEYPETEHPSELSELAYTFMMRLLDACKELDTNDISPSLLRVRKFILKNFDRPLQVEELATLAHMSYAYFCREFIRHFGTPPGKYISQLKFEKAINLLQNTFLSIKEISESCGFSSAGYFCRAFATRFGMPPGDYRKRKKM